MTFTMVPRLIVATCGGTSRSADHVSSLEGQRPPRQDAAVEAEPASPSDTALKADDTRSQAFFAPEELACSKGAQRPVWQPRHYFSQQAISVRDRDVTCLGMKKACERLGLSPHVAGTSFLILDLVLSRIQVKPRLLHIVAVACLHLAIGLERDDTSDGHDSGEEDCGEDGVISDEALLNAADAAFTVGDLHRMRRLLACKLPARDDMPRRPHHIVDDLMEDLDLASCVPRVVNVRRSLSPIPEDKAVDFQAHPLTENSDSATSSGAPAGGRRNDKAGSTLHSTTSSNSGTSGCSSDTSDSSSTDDDDDDDDSEGGSEHDGSNSSSDGRRAGDMGKDGDSEREGAAALDAHGSSGSTSSSTTNSRGRTKRRSRRHQPPSLSRPHADGGGVAPMLSLRRPPSPPSPSSQQKQEQEQEAEQAERHRRARVARLARAKAAAYGLVYRNVASCNARAYAVACVASAMRRVYGRVGSQALVFGMEAKSGLSDDTLRQAAWFRCLTEGAHRVVVADAEHDGRGEAALHASDA